MRAAKKLVTLRDVLWSYHTSDSSSGTTASCVLMCVSIDCVLLSVVMFDPACFYGHHEYDLAIAGMFGGFTRQFYDEYHSIIPESCWF